MGLRKTSRAKVYFRRADGTLKEVEGAEVSFSSDWTPHGDSKQEQVYIPKLSDFSMTVSLRRTLTTALLFGPCGDPDLN